MYIGKTMNIDNIKNNGAIKQVEEEIKSRLYQIKMLTEEAAKAEGVSFSKLKNCCNRIKTYIKGINILYDELLTLRNNK
jgi:hypothetical protein